MVMLKTSEDLRKMSKAGEISVGALLTAKHAIRAGVSTAYIDREVHGYIAERGGSPSFLGYNGFPASVCVSINDEVIHGIPSGRVILRGDVVSIDVGVEYDGFHCDNAATFAVGEVAGEQAKLIRVTEECLSRAVEIVRKGKRIGDIGHAVQFHAQENGFSVVRDFIGHGIGRNLHEEPQVPNYGTAGRGLRLVPGMTIAIEPMINAGNKAVRVVDNGWTVVTLDGRCSAHFEMTVAVTDAEAVVLTDWRGVL